jgi:hypothetical protein
VLPEVALARVAYYAGQVTGLKADYPAPPTLTPPQIVIFWDETDLEEMDEQVWLMRVKGQLYGSAMTGNVKGEILRADPFIVKLADAFSPNSAPPRNAYHLRSATDPGVDYCRLTRIVPSQVLGYAGGSYYGAELYWSIKLRRFAGST